jgi:putative Ca2+/H+ antiporter (TMEM165/GDT1 family)
LKGTVIRMAFAGAVTVMTPFLASVAFVTLNEMGDKTQLLAIAFATRVRFWKVMAGVLIATLLNHGLAVAVGALLASVPGWEGWVKFAAAVLFIFFGIWALKSDKIDSGGAAKKGYGDVATVAIAFFIAEMGDKTQLATITLAANYSYAPLLVLAGTTTGMLIADGIGIVAGVLLHRKLPDKVLKLFAAAAFIFFGLAGLWQSCIETFKLSPGASGAIVAVVAMISLYTSYIIYEKDKKAKAA